MELLLMNVHFPLGKEKGILKNKKKLPDVKIAYVIMVKAHLAPFIACI